MRPVEEPAVLRLHPRRDRVPGRLSAPKTSLESRVPPRQAGQQLDIYLAGRFRYKTRDEWRRLISAGAVTVNGRPAPPGRKLGTGDLVSYSVVLKEPRVDTEVSVVHQEPGFAVAVKPGQLPSHADGNFVTHTFIYILRGMLGGGPEVRLVHRLDRETSGLMVVSRTKTAHANLMRQFAESTVEKEYLAVVKGKIDRDRFEVEGPFGRDPRSGISVRHGLVPAGTPGAKPSRTSFERVEILRGATLVKCIPHTGRTNQIRAHLASIGHPVVGDKLYGKSDEEYLEFVRHVRAGGDPGFAGHAETPRQLLHASRLSFDDPDTAKRLTFRAPLPADMREYLDSHR